METDVTYKSPLRNLILLNNALTELDVYQKLTSRKYILLKRYTYEKIYYLNMDLTTIDVMKKPRLQTQLLVKSNTHKNRCYSTAALTKINTSIIWELPLRE